MQRDILSNNQVALIPFLKEFKRNYYLAGGTAIALQIGHRRSVDFDLFSESPLKKRKISTAFQQLRFKKQIIFSDENQHDYLINDVKCTFLFYPYSVSHTELFEDIISMPSLIDLAAMKAFALGRRSKWKDFVDLYFLLRYHFSMKEIIEKAKTYFPDQITEKLFRNQLAFHNDIDFSEEVDFLVDNPPSTEEVKNFLIETATQPF